MLQSALLDGMDKTRSDTERQRNPTESLPFDNSQSANTIFASLQFVKIFNNLVLSWPQEVVSFEWT